MKALINEKFDCIELRVDAVPCSNNCDMCYSGALDHKIMPADEILDFASKFKPYAKIAFLGTRNEIVDHPEIEKIMEFCCNDPFNPIQLISTNGHAIVHKEKYNSLEWLKKYKVSNFQFTVMGSQKTHDKHAHRNGAFRDMLLAAKKAKSHGFKIRWNYFLFANETGDVRKTVNTIAEISCSNIKIKVPAYSGNAIIEDDIRPKFDEVSRLFAEFKDYLKLPSTEREATEICKRTGNLPEEYVWPYEKMLAIRLKQNLDLCDSLFPNRKIGNARDISTKEIIERYLSLETQISKLWKETSDLELAEFSENSNRLYWPSCLRKKWFMAYVKSKGIEHDFMAFYIQR